MSEVWSTVRSTDMHKNRNRSTERSTDVARERKPYLVDRPSGRPTFPVSHAVCAVDLAVDRMLGAVDQTVNRQLGQSSSGPDLELILGVFSSLYKRGLEPVSRVGDSE